MFVQPNSTKLIGRLRAVHADRAGHGHELEIDVSENLTSDSDTDFLKPAPGSTITLFAAEPPQFDIGSLLKVDAALLAGPFGQRAVAVGLCMACSSSSPRQTGSVR